jgi:hypothetical protein
VEEDNTVNDLYRIAHTNEGMRVGLALLARTDSKDAGELQKEETTINGKGKN